MATGREINRRIRSIKNTHQITRAMELVAAAKMRKAQEQVLASRTYSDLAWDLIRRLSRKSDPRIHKLLSRPKGVKKILIVLITSNRGLIGAFNNNIINTALRYAKRYQDAEFAVLGKKGRDEVRKRGYKLAGEFEKKDSVSSYKEVAPLSRLVTDDFSAGKYGKVTLVYMDYISTLNQKPHIRELLPLRESKDEALGNVNPPSPEDLSAEVRLGRTEEDGEGRRERLQDGWDYLFEPAPDRVLETLIPRMVEMQIYQALLETNASEHSARMVAMKNASEAADDLTFELTLEYNQLRQANITREISEIVGGRLALEN